MEPVNTLKIGNASAFWGDSNDAPARLVAQAPNLDYLTLDYLAEVSMSITTLAKQRQRDPSAGHALRFFGRGFFIGPLLEGRSQVAGCDQRGRAEPDGLRAGLCCRIAERRMLEFEARHCHRR